MKAKARTGGSEARPVPRSTACGHGVRSPPSGVPITAPPQFEPLAGGKGVRVTFGDSSEEIYLATDPAPEAGGQAVIRRSGRAAVILKAKALPPL